MKYEYKRIIVRNISIHNESEIEFSQDKKVTPIIGLNGSGKTVFLNILEKILDDSFPDNYRQLFEKDNSENEFPHIVIETFDEIEYSDEIFEQLSILGIIPEINSKTNKFAKIYIGKFNFKKFIIVPVNETDQNYMIDIKSKIEELSPDNFKQVKQASKQTLKLLSEKLMTFESLSLEKNFNILLSEHGLDKCRNILTTPTREEGESHKFYRKIFDKTLANWKNELKKYIDELDKIKSGLDGREKEDVVKRISNEIKGKITGANETPERKKALESIFLNLSGRRFEDGYQAIPIRTIPSILLTLTAEPIKNDFDVIMEFRETDTVSGDVVPFPASEKNDGFNLIFWYIIFTNYIIDNQNEKYILIDELGNYLNPKVINHFIDLLSLSEHRTIFTSHNPYSLKLETLGSTHVCIRNSRNNFTSLSHIKTMIGEVIEKNGSGINATLKIIHDAMSINGDFTLWNISLDKRNIYVEGLSDAIAIKIFDSSEALNPIIMNGSDGAYKFISNSILFDDIDALSLVDSDWVRQNTGKGKFEISEMKYMDKFILKIDEISNSNFLDLEDIFIQADLSFIKNEIGKGQYSEIKKLKSISDNSYKTKIKNLIISEIFNIAQLTKQEIIERDPNYINVYNTFENIVSFITNK